MSTTAPGSFLSAMAACTSGSMASSFRTSTVAADSSSARTGGRAAAGSRPSAPVSSRGIGPPPWPGDGALPRLASGTAVPPCAITRASAIGPNLHHYGVGLYFAVMDRLRGTLFLAVLLVLLWPTSAAGQGAVVRVTGTVHDDGGKPVAGRDDHRDQSRSDAGHVHRHDRREGPVRHPRAAARYVGVRHRRARFPDRARQRRRADQPLEPARGGEAGAGLPPPAGPTANLTGAELQTLDRRRGSRATGRRPRRRGGGLSRSRRGFHRSRPSISGLAGCSSRRVIAAGALEAYRELARVDPDNARAAAAIARSAHRQER